VACGVPSSIVATVARRFSTSPKISILLSIPCGTPAPRLPLDLLGYCLMPNLRRVEPFRAELVTQAEGWSGLCLPAP
jgi:hypothetical protein